MKTNKILGLMATLMISGQAMAYDQDESPDFNSFICEAGDLSVQVDLQHHRQTHGTGPATIKSGDSGWLGDWHWRAAHEDSRLSGYHFLNVQTDRGFMYLNTLHDPYGKLSGGWLGFADYSGPVDCEILD